MQIVAPPNQANIKTFVMFPSSDWYQLTFFRASLKLICWHNGIWKRFFFSCTEHRIDDLCLFAVQKKQKKIIESPSRRYRRYARWTSCLLFSHFCRRSPRPNRPNRTKRTKRKNHKRSAIRKFALRFNEKNHDSPMLAHWNALNFRHRCDLLSWAPG